MSTPGEDAARGDAHRTDCCANDAWRDHLCPYHDGWATGFDVVVEALETLDDRWRVVCTTGHGIGPFIGHDNAVAAAATFDGVGVKCGPHKVERTKR